LRGLSAFSGTIPGRDHAFEEQHSNAKKFAMTRSTRLATLRLAALTLALSGVAVDASAAGLFGWRDRSNESNAASTAPNATTPNATAPSATAQPARTTENAPSDLDSALIKAQLSRRLGDFAEATKILSQLVLFAPDDPRVMGEYGKTLAAQGKSDDALAFLERAIQLQPTEWSYHSAMGVAYDQKGNYPFAQAAYTRALKLKPGEAAVLNNAALSYMQSGDLDMAEKMIREAEMTSTDKARIQYTVALVERAKAVRAAKAPAAPMPAPAPERPVPGPAVIASLPPPSATPAQPVTESNQPIIQDMPVASASLPPLEQPVEDWVDVTPAMPAPTALASLQSNPTVVMQAVPKDDLAGPVQSRAEPKEVVPAPKKAAPTAPKAVAAAPERKQLSVSANPPLTASAQSAPAPKAEGVHAYYVQAGAFATEERADKLAQSLDIMGARVSPTTVGGRSLYRVRIGPFKDAQQANDALDVAKSLGHTDVKVVSE
jgi:Flp pilus assembly protein TadD